MRSKGGGNFLQRRSNAGFGAFSKDVKLEHGKIWPKSASFPRTPSSLFARKLITSRCPDLESVTMYNFLKSVE